MLDLYYVYGFLLLENQEYDKAEEYLKKAIRINPVSARIILELTEIYKVHTYTFNEFIIRTSDALKYAYYPQDIARCYRNLGYYYVEENQMRTALALYIYSMEFEASPLAYTEIKVPSNQKTTTSNCPLKNALTSLKAKTFNWA